MSGDGDASSAYNETPYALRHVVRAGAPMMNAPASIPIAALMPPEKRVPPMIAAVIVSSSMPIPAFGKRRLLFDKLQHVAELGMLTGA